ncbi:MAG: oxygen-independent coproporphyrinogen III oxidase [Candidatus Krumholzibacteriales bacterium]
MIDKELISKYNVAGPRYTSYPPANRFSEEFGEEDYINILKSSNEKQPHNISLYFHVPFCPRICHFCGCNTSLCADNDTVENYFSAVIEEMEKVSSYLDLKRRVTQIHWGGGTPNSIPFSYIDKLMGLLLSRFSISPGAEVAIECSPAYLELNDIDDLREMGFNRLSIGVQDFNPEVLKRLNRLPLRYPVENICRKADEAGFKGVNIDLIYGLPGQKFDDFIRSVKRVVEISPERVVTFSYAHVPWFKENQKRAEKYRIPPADEKLKMLEVSFDILTGAGYQAIGMDHYAKPGDELYKALQRKELRRNFQGYCTRETTGQVYAFGATAISQLTEGYSQNVRSVNEYIDSVNSCHLPVMRGYVLDDKEKIVRKVITEIMCNHFVDFAEIAEDYGIASEELKEILELHTDKIQPFIDDGLVEYGGGRLRVLPAGFFLIRNIAMALDPALDRGGNQYSKTI